MARINVQVLTVQCLAYIVVQHFDRRIQLSAPLLPAAINKPSRSWSSVPRELPRTVHNKEDFLLRVGPDPEPL